MLCELPVLKVVAVYPDSHESKHVESVPGIDFVDWIAHTNRGVPSAFRRTTWCVEKHDAPYIGSQGHRP
jgi:hypothetical protein